MDPRRACVSEVKPQPRPLAVSDPHGTELLGMRVDGVAAHSERPCHSRRIDKAVYWLARGSLRDAREPLLVWRLGGASMLEELHHTGRN